MPQREISPGSAGSLPHRDASSPQVLPLPHSLLDALAVPMMDKPGWAGMALPRCFSHGKQGHRTPGETLITGSVKPPMVPQLAPLRVPQLQARVCSHQPPKLSFCGIQRDPAAASSPCSHREHERRCESPQLTASVNPQHNTAVPAATTFPWISCSLLPLSRLPSCCLLPDSCVSLGTSCVRNILPWWH